MTRVGRLIAFIGLVLIGVGLVMPVVCDNSECKIIDNGLIDPKRFEDDTNFGIITSLQGLLIVVALVPILLAIVLGDRTSMLIGALVATVSTAFVFADLFITLEDLPDTSIGWGWGVLGGGCLMALVSTLFAAQQVQPEAAPTTQKHQAPVGAPQQRPPAGLFKTAIDIGYNLRRQAPPSAPPKTQPGAQAPAQRGFGKLDSSKATMLDLPSAPPEEEAPAPTQRYGVPPVIQNFAPDGDDVDPSKATAVDLKKALEADPMLKTQIQPEATPQSSATPVQPQRPAPARPQLPEDLERTNIATVWEPPPQPPPSPPPPAQVVPPPTEKTFIMSEPSVPPVSDAMYKTQIEVPAVPQKPADDAMYKTQIESPTAPSRGSDDALKTQVEMPSSAVPQSADLYKSQIDSIPSADDDWVDEDDGAPWITPS